MAWKPGYKRPKPRTKFTGVYAIRHISSGRIYIGASTDMTGRFTHHRFTLRKGEHKTKALQADWLLYGEGAFEFEVLAYCEKLELSDLEQAKLDAYPDAYNTTKFAQPGKASAPSDAKKEASRKKWARPDYRAKREAFLQNRVGGRFQKV